jgi:hypothetical protein
MALTPSKSAPPGATSVKSRGPHPKQEAATARLTPIYALQRLLQLIVLCFRSAEFKELEIVVGIVGGRAHALCSDVGDLADLASGGRQAAVPSGGEWLPSVEFDPVPHWRNTGTSAT